MSMCDVSNNQITNKKLCIVKWQKVFFTARQRSCGKVMFSVVSVIMFRKGPHATITHDPQPPASPYRDIRGPYCTGTHLGPTTPAPEHIKFVHYEAHAVGERVVGILPECILVFQFLCIYTFCELATGTSTVQWSIGDFYFVQSFRSGEVKWRKVITLWRSNSLWPTKV